MLTGNPVALTELEHELESFPHGMDPALHRYWLTNAIHYGALDAVAWMIERKVNLSYLDDEGHTPLMSTFDVDDKPLRIALLRLLLGAGARHDLVGTNVWTVAHFAACYGDVDALRILAEFGADLCACTEDLGSWSTPADVARFNKHSDALIYLESICAGRENKVYRSRM